MLLMIFVAIGGCAGASVAAGIAGEFGVAFWLIVAQAFLTAVLMVELDGGGVRALQAAALDLWKTLWKTLQLLDYYRVRIFGHRLVTQRQTSNQAGLKAPRRLVDNFR